jgi:hypothetical protein
MPFRPKRPQKKEISKEEKETMRLELLKVEKKAPKQMYTYRSTFHLFLFSNLGSEYDGDIDLTLASALVFKGAESLQKLFNFLLDYQNQAEGQRKEVHLPMIYTSKTPFIGATLQRLQVAVATYHIPREDATEEELKILDEKGKKRTAELPVRHKVDITGPMFPDTIIELARLFKESQTSFVAHFHQFPDMDFLNKILAAATSTDTKEALPPIEKIECKDGFFTKLVNPYFLVLPWAPVFRGVPCVNGESKERS